jgi:hypothetical protein
MIAAEVKQMLAIVHDEQPILIKIGGKYVAVKDMRRAQYDGKICQVFVPVDIVLETK